MKNTVRLLLIWMLFGCLIPAQTFALFAQDKPNIVVILTDDQGYADISFNPYHPDEVHTPHMDSLAREGIFFTQAYTSGNTCSPTRAGLMTGRYQHRAGIYDSGEGGSGLPLDETVFPQFLTPEGYVCGAFGKWHLGLTPDYNPISRGFNEFFGFMGRGAHDYYDLDNPESPLYRGLETTTAQGYLTNILTDEAVDFIKRHKNEPFFCYLAYNAVHSPPQAPAEDIADFNTGDPTRDILMAMLRHLDNGVGEVVRTLKEEGIWENTLLIFLTDNGGASAMSANNAPLRNFKQTNWEGGIRTPFIFSWPAKYQGGRQVHAPIISLDILPTVLDAVGVNEPVEKPFDGRSILPLLDGDTAKIHDMLFWTEGGEEGEWAVRDGQWKLVVVKDQIELFDLETDPSETTNLKDVYPDTVDTMIIAFEAWLDEMPDPNQISSKRWAPSPPSGKALTLYDKLYYNGAHQDLATEGIYNAADLAGIGNNLTRSIALANGFDAVIFSEDSLSGNEMLHTSGVPYLGPFDAQVSSLVLYPEGSLDMRQIDISASIVPETAPNTRDGDLGTYWESAQKGSWIMYTFCREASLKGISIAFKRGDLRVAYFDLDVSLDGTNWMPVISGGASNGTQRSPELFSFPEVKARYIRITGYGNSDNSQNHYTEVDFVFGEEIVYESRVEAEDYSSAQGVRKIICDDCQGLLAIEIAAGSHADYTLTRESPSDHKMNIRLKALQAGSLEILARDTYLATLEVGTGAVDNTWRTFSKSISLPGGEFTLSLRSGGSGEEGLFEINWFEFTDAVPVEEIKDRGSPHIAVFPNPCAEELHVFAGASLRGIRVFDTRGRLILERRDHGRQVSIQTYDLAAGIYFLQILTKEGFQYRRFVKS